MDDLGTLPLDAAPWQTTRYLRLANATPKKVSVQLRYFVETGPHKTAWLPERPDSADGAWTTVELEAGETADLKDGDWRINARRVCVWAKAGDQEWDQFPRKP